MNRPQPRKPGRRAAVRPKVSPPWRGAGRPKPAADAGASESSGQKTGGARPAAKPVGKAGWAKSAPKAPSPARKSDRFYVMIAVNRPRYRSRAERAVAAAGWEVVSLLNKQDPIGMMNQQRPDVVIIADEFGRNKSLCYIRAAQKWRAEGMKLVALFEDPAIMAEVPELYDAAFAPPWRTIQVRQTVAAYHEEIRGAAPVFGEPLNEANEDTE